jgi:hypothetical protein
MTLQAFRFDPAELPPVAFGCRPDDPDALTGC